MSNWQAIGNIALSKEWQFSEPINYNFFKVKNTLYNSQATGKGKGLFTQALVPTNNLLSPIILNPVNLIYPFTKDTSGYLFSPNKFGDDLRIACKLSTALPAGTQWVVDIFEWQEMIAIPENDFSEFLAPSALTRVSANFTSGTFICKFTTGSNVSGDQEIYNGYYSSSSRENPRCLLSSGKIAWYRNDPADVWGFVSAQNIEPNTTYLLVTIIPNSFSKADFVFSLNKIYGQFSFGNMSIPIEARNLRTNYILGHYNNLRPFLGTIHYAYLFDFPLDNLQIAKFS